MTWCTWWHTAHSTQAEDLARKANELAEQLSDTPAHIEALLSTTAAKAAETADVLASGVQLAKSQAYREYLNQCAQAAPLLQLRGKRYACLSQVGMLDCTHSTALPRSSSVRSATQSPRPSQRTTATSCSLPKAPRPPPCWQ